MTREQRELIRRRVDQARREQLLRLRRMGWFGRDDELRVCACGCGQPLAVDARSHARYFSKRCRDTAHRRRRSAAKR